MRWLPTISFYHSSSSSLKSSPSSSSSYHLEDVALHHPKRRSGGAVTAWIFGSGKRSSRSRKLRPLGEHDGKSVPKRHDSGEETATAAPSSNSPCCYVRSNTTSSASCLYSSNPVAAPQPQPLPLPEASLRNNGDRALPSPPGKVPGPVTCARSAEERDKSDGVVSEGASPPFRMRSVFASQNTRRNMEQVETSSYRKVHQDLIGYDGTRDNFGVSVPTRSAPTSPFASPTVSPQKTRKSDFVPYHYVTPKGTQFWSAPEIPHSEALAGLPPAFFDLSSMCHEISSFHGPQGRSPRQNRRSSSGTSSPIQPSLSLDTPTGRWESNAPTNVHPLPLPPGAALPSLSPHLSQTVAKSDSLSMKCQWQKGKLIGRGTFGSVYVATNRETGALCAMKEVEIFPDDPKSTECVKQLEQEIKVLSQLKHPNIVQYYGSEIVEDKFYIYLEYVHPGSINKYFREHCSAITEAVVRNFTRHILSGLAYLHGKKTIHRDIKGANLLVDSAGVVKLADFGMAKHLTGHVADLSMKGSPYWMAPELMLAVMQKDSSDLAFAVDIWSLGCTIIEMFTGKPPWSEYEGAAAMFKVMKDTPAIPETLSSEGKDFLKCCFKRNPAERATAAMLLEHRFLKNSQQADIPSSTQLYNGITLMERPISPIGFLEDKHDRLSNINAQIAKEKATNSGVVMLPLLYS